MAKKKPSKTIIIIKKEKPKKRASNSEVGYKKPPKHSQFKKGEVANPTGVNISKEKRLLKTITDKTIAEAITLVLTSTPTEIKAALADKETPVGQLIILRASLDAAEDGAFTRFNEILERVIGKVPTKVNMTLDGQTLSEKLADKEKVKAAMKEVESEF